MNLYFGKTDLFNKLGERFFNKKKKKKLIHSRSIKQIPNLKNIL